MTRILTALVCGWGVLCSGAPSDAETRAPLTPDATRPAAPARLARFAFEQPHMGTTARVVLYAHSPTEARELAGRAFTRIADLDARLSDYRPDSELMALCRAAGGPPVAVSEDLFTVLTAALRLSQRTGGAFDITVGPLSRLWRRARVTGQPPDAEAVAAAKTLIGYQHIELSSARTARLARGGMLLDLGGIAKGYAADAALAALGAHGAHRALVSIGGDVVAGDAPPGKDGWVVSVAPLGPAAGSALVAVTLRRAALSSSGDAEQYLEHNGTRLSHILTPRTGHAVEGRRGVTVLGPDGMTADALATAVSVLGVERGLPLIDELPHSAALILESSPRGIREHRSARW